MSDLGRRLIRGMKRLRDVLNKDRRKFLRCNKYGHEPFHMRDNGTWTCECGINTGTWGAFDVPDDSKERDS